MRRNLVLSLLVFVCLAASAQAGESFVVLVDEERGLDREPLAPEINVHDVEINVAHIESGNQ